MQHFLLIILLFCAWLGAQQPALAGSFRQSTDTAAMPLEIRRVDSVWMVNAPVLTRLLALQTRWNPGAHRLQAGKSFWTQDNPWVVVGDSVSKLPVPVRMIDGTLWAPLPAALAPLRQASGKELVFNPELLRIEAGAAKDMLSADLQSLDNGEMLEIRFSRKVKAEFFQNEPYSIIRFENTVLDTALLGQLQKKSSLFSRLLSVQDAKSAQITLQLRDICESAEMLRRDSGRTVQILLRKKASPPSTSSSSTSKAATGKGRIRTIVLDPGHGGKDPGAIGVKSLQEKDIVLAVALKLKKKLTAQGYQVKLTRDDDNFVELPDRPAMASKWEGDLFISLHCNAVDGAERQKKTEGFKFYILREAESEEDKAIARRENKAIELSASKKGKSEISPVEWILLENQLNTYTKESERFTGYLVESYEGGTIKKMSSGAGQAGFMVLVGAFMPAVLVEIGFITNPVDAAFMGTTKGQDDISTRLFKAIQSYSKAVGN